MVEVDGLTIAIDICIAIASSLGGAGGMYALIRRNITATDDLARNFSSMQGQIFKAIDSLRVDMLKAVGDLKQQLIQAQGEHNRLVTALEFCLPEFSDHFNGRQH